MPNASAIPSNLITPTERSKDNPKTNIRAEPSDTAFQIHPSNTKPLQRAVYTLTLNAQDENN
ncbi:hypothetical protein G9A89_012357 [Geosiphon pyriformis]|nr:hypothetical protein G9A89_012357 [Geosiphon pyriformis]